MEYYIGQVFEGIYPPDAAVWCADNNAYIDEIEERVYEIKEIPEPPAPTKEEQQAKRKAAYEAEVDELHSQKLRHEVLGDWTEEDEEEYKATVIGLSKEIAERYPYPTDPIFEG